MTFWFCGKSWREKQRHKGAPEGGSRRNPWCAARTSARPYPTAPPACCAYTLHRGPSRPRSFFPQKFYNPKSSLGSGRRHPCRFLPACCFFRQHHPFPYPRHLNSSSPQLPVPDNELIAIIFPGKVIIVEHGKLVRHERAWYHRMRAQLSERWGWAPRSRFAGAGSKPP